MDKSTSRILCVRDSHKLTVIVRTLGYRLEFLRETLESISEQISSSVEVIVVCHNGDQKTIISLNSLAYPFIKSLKLDIRILNVSGGLRGKPLNIGLKQATGCLVAFLDDDDVVFSNWASVLLQAHQEHPSSLVRGRVWLQYWQELAPNTRIAKSELLDSYPHNFNLEAQFNQNQSPIHAYGVPLPALRTLRLTFDEELDAFEDWDFFTRVACRIKVVDCEEWIAVYRKSQKVASLESQAAALAYEFKVRRKLDFNLVFPKGIAHPPPTPVDGVKLSLIRQLFVNVKIYVCGIQRSITYWFIFKYAENLSWSRRVARQGTIRHTLLKSLASRGLRKRL